MPRDDTTPKSISIHYDGCSDDQTSKVSAAWDDAIAMAKAVVEIKLDEDPAALDYFGPFFQTKGYGFRILAVYDNIASFKQKGLNPIGWRVNAFCGEENDKKWRGCENK